MDKGSARGSGSAADAVAFRWWRYGAAAGTAVAAVVALFHRTAWSIVSEWIHSDMFDHGFLIIPIVIWLVWGKRQELAQVGPSPEYRVAWLVAVLGWAWFLAGWWGSLAVQQFAFVGLLVASLWLVLGNRTARILAFPLGFLFFAVPVGGDLVPPMMAFTADFTVGMLRLTGLPVAQDGLMFALPTGAWNVIETCSGARYLISSLTVGVLFAYVSYQRWWKRLLFVVFSLVVPVFANGLRAYIIVMLAHLSRMKLAVGVDHFIYGWVFFSFVVFVMFLVGSIWSDPPAGPRLAGSDVSPEEGGAPLAYVWAGLVAVAVAALWPLVAFILGVAGHGPGIEAAIVPAVN